MVGHHLSVCLSVCPSFAHCTRLLLGLLLCAQQAGIINRLLHGWLVLSSSCTTAQHSATNARSAVFTAGVGS